MSAEEVEGDQAREQALKRHMAELDDLIDHSKELLSYINFKFNKSFKSSRAESCFLTQQPASLKGGVLLEHQMSGVNWLICLYERKKNGILADDMGLGKTIQAIAFIAYLAEVRNDRGPHLVIVPKSVLSNFQEECLRWLPSHRSIILPGDYEARNFALQNYVSKRKFDILLATYQSVTYCLNKLSRILWSCMVVDEAHKIKNSESQRFLALSSIEAEFKLLMTGTPIGCDIKDIWSLLNFIEPTTFSDKGLFQRPMRLIDEIESEPRRQEATETISKKFQTILRPYMLRRNKKEISLGLPPKKQKTIYIGMTSLQVNYYREMIERGTVGGKAFSNISIQCRKICSHPFIYKHIRPNKLQMNSILASAKLIVLDKLLEKLLREDRRILVFTQFLDMLRLLEEYCSFRRYSFFTLEGSTATEDRAYMIKQFEKGGADIFLLSTRAGSLGINLVAADTVVLYDSDWNPQIDLQAMDRAYRIGQTKEVHVYRLVTQNSVDQRIHQTQKARLLMDLNVIQKGRLFYESQQEHTIQSYYNAATFRPTPTELLSDANIEALIRRGESIDSSLQQKIRNKAQQLGGLQDEAGAGAFDLPLEELYLRNQHQMEEKKVELRKMKEEQKEEQQKLKQQRQKEKDQERGLTIEQLIQKLRAQKAEKEGNNKKKGKKGTKDKEEEAKEVKEVKEKEKKEEKEEKEKKEERRSKGRLDGFVKGLVQQQEDRQKTKKQKQKPKRAKSAADKEGREGQCENETDSSKR